jgi:hypothetical protein
VQAFEPRLTGELFARWPDRVAEVLAQDDERGWLLLGDAGTPLRVLGNSGMRSVRFQVRSPQSAALQGSDQLQRRMAREPSPTCPRPQPRFQGVRGRDRASARRRVHRTSGIG